MLKPLGEVIFNFQEKQEEYGESRKELIEKAVEMGASEKSINGDHRIAMAYLVGYRNGRRHEA